MVIRFFDRDGIDITEDSMEVYPTCHYAMGGVRVDADTTAGTVPGLFAAGELIFVLGDVLFSIYNHRFPGAQALSTASQLVYLGGYPLLAWGLLRLIRQRSPASTACRCRSCPSGSPSTA